MKKMLAVSIVLLVALYLLWMFAPTASSPGNSRHAPEMQTPAHSPTSAHQGSGRGSSQASSQRRESFSRREAGDGSLSQTTPDDHSQELISLNLSGVVVTEDDRPIADARVLYGLPHETPSATRSDANGAFQVQMSARRADRLIFTAMKEGFLQRTSTVFVDQADQPITLKLSVSQFPTRGKVVDEDNLPLAEVQLSCQRAANDGAWLEMTSTNADGAFSLDLDAHYRRVQFVKDGFQTRIENLGDDQREAIIVVLKKPTTLEGQVIDDETERPLPRFSIWIAGEDAAPIQFLEFEDPEGRFTIPNLAAGDSHQMTVTATDHVPAHLDQFQPQPGDPPRLIRMKPATQVFRGRVVDSEGEGVPRVDIQINGNPEWVDRHPWYPSPDLVNQWPRKSPQIGSTVTDEAGNFEIPGLHIEGRFQLHMAKPGYATQVWPYLVSILKTGMLKKNWVLNREGGIRFWVDRNAFPDSLNLHMIHDFGRDFNQPLSTYQFDNRTLRAEETEYLYAPLPPGKYNFSADTLDNKTLVDEEVNLMEGEFVDITLDLLHNIEGQAFMNQIPLAYGTVYLHIFTQDHQWNQPPTRVRTDEAGRFSFDQVPSGEHRLFATQGDTDYKQTPRVEQYGVPVHVADDDVKDTFHFRRFGSLRVQFAGTMPKKAGLINEMTGGRVMDSVGNGVFIGHNVPPGDYTLRDVYTWRKRIPLVERVVMPEDGSDVDLGLIDDREKGSLRLRFHGDLDSIYGYLLVDRVETKSRLFHDRLDFKTDKVYPELSEGLFRLTFMGMDHSHQVLYQGEIIDYEGIEAAVHPKTETTLDLEIRAICVAIFTFPTSWQITQIHLSGAELQETLVISQEGENKGEYLTYNTLKSNEMNISAGMAQQTPPGIYQLTVDYVNAEGEAMVAKRSLEMTQARLQTLEFQELNQPVPK